LRLDLTGLILRRLHTKIFTFNRMVVVRKTRKAMKGGFHNSAIIWSFAICKMLVDVVGYAPAGTKKSWRECLNFLASRVGLTPEHLYNKMTPEEFLIQVSKDSVLGKDRSGKFQKPWLGFQDNWQYAAQKRDEAIATGKTWGNNSHLRLVDLPGKPKNETQIAAERERQKQAFFKERSPMEGKPWYERRKMELEEGASINASEECESRFDDGTADPGLCLAARKGTAKRIAAREATLKEAARKAAVNANASERWSDAKGELLALAAKEADTNTNFSAVYNGVRTGAKATKKNPLGKRF
jgi:hypothetical protein